MDIVLKILLPTALTALALWRRALTRGGLLLAWGLGLVISLCGGVTGFLALAAVFLCTVAAGRLNRRLRERVEREVHAKRGRRDAVQVACNVATGALMLLLWRLTGWRGLLYAYGGAMAASLADSLASELGILSRRRPRDVLTRALVPRGLSGGVTAFGFAMSAVGAAVVALICALGWGEDQGAWMGFSVTLSGVLAALGDSVLGSALQAKYRCPVCGALTERPVHCGVPGALERGLAGLNNDGVNLCNNLLGAGLGMLLYIIGI